MEKKVKEKPPGGGGRMAGRSLAIDSDPLLHRSEGGRRRMTGSGGEVWHQ